MKHVIDRLYNVDQIMFHIPERIPLSISGAVAFFFN